MSRKYSRIHAAARYQAALTSYIRFIDGTANRQPGIGTGRARAASQILYIKPFGIDLPAGDFARTTGAQPSWATYGPQLSARATTTLAANTNGLRLSHFKAARVLIGTGRSTTGTVKTSHITGMKYLSYGGRSTSLPFGHGSTTDTEIEVFTGLKTAIQAAHAGSIVTLQPEDLN